MSSHRPKTAALIAYAEGLLSAEGSRRLRRHLDRCETCRRELAAIELYDEMVADARRAPVPEIDFDGMEMALAREARRVSTEIHARRQRRAWIPIAALAAAAAALLVVWAGWPWRASRVAERPAPVAEETAPAPAPRPAPEPAYLAPVVTLAAGAAHEVSSDGPAPLEPGEELREGAQLRTGDESKLHVRLHDGTGILLEEDGALALTEAREDAVRLTLERGTVAQEVAPLSNGARYVVLAGGHEVEVRGTRFAVSFVEGVVGVDLAEGVVEVRPPDAEPFELTAPARWRSDGAREAGAPEVLEVEVPEVPTPRGLHADDAEGVAVTLAAPDLVRWEVDGTTVASAGDVRLRLSPGEHEVRGWDLRGRLHVGLVPVSSEPLTVGPDALEPEAPRIRPGHLEESEIASVLQRGRRQIQRCYEVSLRRGATVGGRMRLRVTVGLMGEVRRARVLGLEGRGADELRQCIGNYAGRWTFPPPGGPVTFEVPLNLTAR